MGSYYNIDAILTDAQKVPCTFTLDLPGMGYLDDNAGGDVLLLTALLPLSASANDSPYRSKHRLQSPSLSGFLPCLPFSALDLRNPHYVPSISHHRYLHAC